VNFEKIFRTHNQEITLNKGNIYFENSGGAGSKVRCRK